jgi:hypothetical protein
VATRLVPDLDHFRGSFGARAVIPLWVDRAGSHANVAPAILQRLSRSLRLEVDAETLLSYCYALLGTRGYWLRFAEELRTPGPRIPLTRDAGLFCAVAKRGRELLDVHTFSAVRRGAARCLTAVGDQHPRAFAYEATSQVLRVGGGCFAPVDERVWSYAVSGYAVVRGWLRRRVGERARNAIEAAVPAQWTAMLDRELVELLWVLEATLALEPTLDELLDSVIASSAR